MLNPEQGGTERAAPVGVLADGADRSLLLVDDDAAFRTRLGRAMEAKGYEVRTAASVREGLTAIAAKPPAFVVTDLRVGEGSGLDIVDALHRSRPEARSVVLTGYGNIASAVTAMRRGAFDFLAKPADAEQVHGTLASDPGSKEALPEVLMSADRVKWEHIQRAHELCGHNVSETARRLGMHRRTLQRILQKRAPR